MPSEIEKKQRFDFPDGWTTTKFDEWSFYKGQFSELGKFVIRCPKCKRDVRCMYCQHSRMMGVRGVDFLVIDADEVCWQIEVKDFRLTLESNFEFLADAVAAKVRDTLACLVVARRNANSVAEQEFAAVALAARQYRVVLQLEQPVPSRRIDTKEMRATRVYQRLKQLVKGIDVRPLVVDAESCVEHGWTTTDID